QVAKDSAWNWAVGRVTQSVSLGTGGNPLLNRVLSGLEQSLRASEPMEASSNYREWMLRQEYDFMQGTLTTAEFATSFVPVGEIAEAGRLAAGKLPALKGADASG